MPFSRRHLVLQLKRLGDVLLTAPLVQALRARDPESEIHFLAKGATACEVANLISGIHVVHDMDAPGTWRSLLTNSWVDCLDLCGSDRAALCTLLTKATHRIGHKQWVGNWPKRCAYTALNRVSVLEKHTIDFNLSWLDLLPEPFSPESGHSPPTFQLRIPQEAHDHVASLLQAHGLENTPFAVIHPGSAREDKFWEPERWAETATRLLDTSSLPVVLTGSNAAFERSHLEQILKLEPRIHSFAGKVTLTQMASLLQKATLVLSVDTFTMHLAAALQRPQVALYGPVNPFQWRPLHDRAAVIHAASAQVPLLDFTPRMSKTPMDRITSDQMWQAIESLHLPLLSPSHS